MQSPAEFRYASYVNGSTDLNGNARTQGGTVDMGCYEGVVDGYVVAIEVQGSGTVTNTPAFVQPGGAVTFAALEGERPFLGFYTNGVLATTSREFTWTGITADGSLTAKFVHEIYADASRPDDTGDGYSWATAKRSLQAAINEATEGDTVWVADGVYGAISTANRRIDVRAANAGHGAVVDGGGTSRCATLGEANGEVKTHLYGLTLRNGSATYGGGVRYGTIHDCVISGCRASSNGGGAYYTLSNNSRFENNVAIQNGGGTFYGTSVGCEYAGNTAQNGGGDYNGTLRGCRLSGNSATYGGGTCNSSVSDSELVGNIGGSGGGSYNSNVYRCRFEGNRATNGGGFFTSSSSYGLFNSLLVGNSASSTGGGYYSESSSPSCYNNTVVGNTAASAAGVYRGYWYNSVIWGNYLLTGVLGNCSNGSYNYTCTTPAASGTGNISADPNFVDASNGDYRLLVGSQCLNAGNASYVNGSIDLAGRPRTNEGVVDMGCYEGPAYLRQITVITTGIGNILDNGKSVIDGGMLSFTAVESGYPFLGFYTNGVFATSEKSFMWHDICADGTIEGVFSEVAVTQTTPEPVSYSWLDSYPEVLAAFGGDYEAMASAPSPGASGIGKTWPNGSPCYVWQDFVAGTSPTNDTVFTATIRMEGNTPVVTWEPDTPELRATRVYRTLGKKTLLDANWTDITDKDQSEYHFFRVTVDMP